MSHIPAFAVVGVPNAGKSTLVNRLTGTRATVVHETPGVTRDRKAIETEWAGCIFKLIDTGGFDTSDDSILGGDIRSQIKAALGEADAAVFVVDGRAGPLSGDHEIADVLRRVKIPTLLVANKIDDPRHETELVVFHELGLGAPLPVSALHGTGSGDLLDEIVALAGRLAGERGAGGDAGQDDERPAEIPVAIVGRPNAGKSSLLNALAGEERVIVGEAAGTTRDAIDTTVSWRGHEFRFVDTAGMRKAARVSGVEYYAYLRSLASLDRAQVAVIVVDATIGMGELDVQIVAEATRRECATLLAVNKSDLAAPDLTEIAGITARKLRQRPQALAVSARTGRGLEHVLQLVTDLRSRYTAHVPTGALNRALSAITEQRAMPGKGRRKLKLYYISQFQTAPPRFAIAVNDRDLVTREFGYFVENRLREALSFQGVPLIIDFKER
jgi:GTP-binding protein